MPAPTITLPVTGTAPNQVATKAALEAAVNAAFAAQQGQIDTKLPATFADPAEAIQGLDVALPVNSAGVYAAVKDSERQIMDALQNRLPAAMTDGVTSPGIAPDRYAVASEGAPGYLPKVDFPLQVATTPEKGKVLEWAGSGVYATGGEEAVRLTPIGVMSLSTGRVWRVRAVYRRATASADPAGDAVRVAIQWMGADFSSAGLSVTETDIDVQTALTPADGWQVVTAVLAQTAGAGVDHVNAAAVYARVFIEQQGNPSYSDGPLISVAELKHDDITFAEVVTDVAAGIEARVTVLESRDVYQTVALSPSADIHGLTAPGDFTVTNPVNGPAMAGSTIGGTFRERNSATGHMLVWDYSASKEGMYWASKVSGAWGGWKEVASVEYVDAELQALANDFAALASSYSARAGAYTVVAEDRGKVLACSGTWTLSLTTAATLGAGFSLIVDNTGTGTITIDPASAELIDGAASHSLLPNASVLVVSTGTGWLTLPMGRAVTSADIFAVYGGTANAITLTTGKPFAAVPVGAQIRFLATAPNTGAVTIAVDGLPAVDARLETGAALPAGHVRTDVETIARFDGTNWVVRRHISRGGALEPTLAFTTPGTSSWAAVTGSGRWRREGNIVIFHGVVTGTPTKGSATGNLQIDPGFRDEAGAPVTILPIINGAGVGVIPVRLSALIGYPAPAKSCGASAEIRHDSGGKIRLGALTNSAATWDLAGVLTSAALSYTAYADGAALQIGFSGSFVVAP